MLALELQKTSDMNTNTKTFETIALAQLDRVSGGAPLIPVSANVGANVDVRSSNSMQTNRQIDGNNERFMRTSFAGRIFQSTLAGLGAPYGQKLTTAANTFGSATRADNRDAIDYELARHGIQANH